jgi:hypothetical protein
LLFQPTAKAEDRSRLPVKFTGLWCGDLKVMTRATKACPRGTFEVRISHNRYNNKFGECAVIDTVTEKDGGQLTTFQCRQTAAGKREAASGSGPDVMNLLFSLVDGKLHIEQTQREPAGPN